MKGVTFSRDQLTTRLAEIVEFAGKLDAADEELRKVSYDPDRHWPAGTGIGGGSGGGPSILVENEEGDLERVPVTSVEAAAMRTDALTDAKQLLWRCVHAAHRTLTDAVNAHERATRHLRKPPPPTDADEIWCTSCARFSINEPRGNPKEIGKDSTWCAFCHRYQKANGQLPPQRLCELRHEGVRLTPQLVATVEAAARREQRNRSPKRKRRRAR